MNIISLDSCKSTNSTARDILDNNINPVPDTIVVARKQTQGRGRSGTWFSPEDCGVYMSVIRDNFTVPTPCPCCDDAQYAIIEQLTETLGNVINNLLIRYFHLQTRVMGINDIYLADRKLAGILCEYHAASNKLIVGMGLNTFRPSKVRKDLLQSAVWLNEYSSEHLIDHAKLVSMIAEEIIKI